jgi:tetratricopeptide (TPR) repeat protein
VLICCAVLVNAAAINWRTDYNVARKEAAEKGRPLLIDFGTENCFWCKRLDASTFQDASVVTLVNERFIPLKIDAEKEAQLTKSLQISSYPTIVFGAPDGKIMGTVVGYKEAAEFVTILQRHQTAPPAAPAAPAAPDWMVRDFAEAGKAVAGSDYARALTLLKPIVEDGKDRAMQQKARQVIQDIEQQAAGRLARAKQLEDKSQYAEAIDGLTELLRVYPGTTAAQEAGQRLSTLATRPEMKGGQRLRRARELLAQAKEDYRTQQYLCCLDRCELLAAHYADLPEGADAVQLAGEIKSNPEWMKTACDNLCDRLGLLYLSLADTWLRKGQPQQAAQYLEKIVQCFPGTRQAEAAQVRLSYLKGETTWQADFKKQ